jgi:SSS family solute:Na+ symporter
MKPTLSPADYGVLVFYFVFMLSMGWVFKRFIKNTSDYFRSGGEMLWWIVGAGAFMTNFSAVSFTGMAGKAYQDGPVVLVIFFAGAIGFFFNYIYFAPVFRQMRCVTAMDAVRKRFGAANEQFFTWLNIPMGMLYAAIWLNGLAVFLTAAFGLDMKTTIILTGLVTLVMSLLGGSWTSTASDFVQMLLLMPVTLVAAVLALMKIGGWQPFFAQTPTHFWNWGEVANSNLIGFWVLAMLCQKWVSLNNMTDASRYLSVKDTTHARKAALLATILFLVGPIVWFIPPMVARILYPDLRAIFPDKEHLPNAQDASYFAIALATMPAGMLGLLISGIFASTMGQMDSGLNRNAGYFIKNFYQVKVRPDAGERELLLASRLVTILFGVLIILATMWFASLDDMPIFKLMVNFGGWVALPIAIPLIWGMFIRRAPSWAGWSTVVIGLATSWFVQAVMTAQWAGDFFGWTLNKREASDWAQAAGIMMNIVIASAWFLLTAALWPVRKPSDATAASTATTEPTSGDGALAYATPGTNNEPSEYDRVDAFFAEMRKPVDFAKEEGGPGSDNVQAKTMGLLCLIYGGFITMLAAIPNPIEGRLSFLFCGLVMFGVGGALYRAGTRGSRSAAADALPGGSKDPVSIAVKPEQKPALERV